MAKNTFYEQREIACINRLDAIVDSLPYYVRDFFVGIELRTSALTRLNYAYDLRVFFDFLTKKTFRNKQIPDITLQDLALLEASDFEYFLSYLSHYNINDKTERCTETGKARKLSTLRAFISIFLTEMLSQPTPRLKLKCLKFTKKRLLGLTLTEKLMRLAKCSTPLKRETV